MPEHKIKLLVFIPSLECGGSEKYVSLLCNTINTQKFAVTLAVVNNAHPFYAISNPSVTVVNLQVQQVRHSFFKIKQLIKQVQPDIIYTNGNHLNLYFALFKNLLAHDITIVARESSIVSINSKRAKLPLIYNGLIRRFYKKLNCIICQSVYMQQDLIANYNIKKSKTVIINNAVEKVALIPVEPEKNKFITIARLSKEKGIDRLIRAVANLTVPFTYHIIGNGDQRDTLQQLITSLQLKDKVFLEGEKNDPFKGMEDASLFLMGSHYEGFPNTLLEAGTLGIAAVAFNAPGGINEIIADGTNGLLVNNDDVNAFTLAIEKAMAINFNRQQIKDDTERKFLVSRIIETTEELFIQLYTAAKTK
jgi:glycosyltransferase involved in cell wall biosynthesis